MGLDTTASRGGGGVFMPSRGDPAMSVQTIALALFVLCANASVARAQVATPFTQSNVPLASLASEVS